MYIENRKHNKNLTQNARELRKNMTKQEKHLWYDFLSLYPVRFIRQKVIGNYIADFYCAKAKLVIEVDGGYHKYENIALRDKIRTRKIEEYDISVIRIPNNDIDRNFKNVCVCIDYFVKKKLGDDLK